MPLSPLPRLRRPRRHTTRHRVTDPHIARDIGLLPVDRAAPGSWR